MTRCDTLVAARPAALALALVAASLPAAAQLVVARAFPATALRGELQVQQPPELSLNGQAARLSPGARIHGTDNLLVMSGALVGQTLLVHYQLEATTGLVQRVWILNESEAANKPWPATAEQAARWLFDPAAQTWTRR